MSRCAITATLLMILFAAGCGGGSGTTAPSSGTPDPLLSDPAQAFAASSQRLESARASRAEFDWRIENPEFDISGSGTYLFVAPDGLDIEAHYQGKGETFDEASDSELLVLGQTAYLKTRAYGPDWVVFTPEELGPEWQYVQNLIAARSPLDYSRTIEGLFGDIEDLGLDGGYAHFRTIMDAGDLMEALADAYATRGQQILGNRFSGPVEIEIWIDPVTLLPHAVEAKGTFQFEEVPTDLALRVDYSDINGEVPLPSAPTEAVPATAALGR